VNSYGSHSDESTWQGVVIAIKFDLFRPVFLAFVCKKAKATRSPFGGLAFALNFVLFVALCNSNKLTQLNQEYVTGKKHLHYSMK
jgi:hypothetical protein